MFDQFNKFYLISMSILLTSCRMIYGYYRKKLHLNHFLYAVINHERISFFLQGCKVKVEVFKTEKKGWEWRTLEDLEL